MIFVVIVGFLTFIVLFALGARFGTEFAGRILGKKINRLHHDAEYILEHEKPPPEWCGISGAHTSDARLDVRKKALVLRRMRKLTRYLVRTPTFTDVESREFVSREMTRILKLWKQSEPRLICGQEPESTTSSSTS